MTGLDLANHMQLSVAQELAKAAGLKSLRLDL